MNIVKVQFYRRKKIISNRFICLHSTEVIPFELKIDLKLFESGRFFHEKKAKRGSTTHSHE